MISHSKKSLPTLLAFVLALTGLTVPGAQAAPAAAGQAEAAQEPMPDELLGAFLAASARPFEVDADAQGYRTRSGGLDVSLRAGGLRATADGLAWGLALSGCGRGEQVARLPEAEIAQTDSRLEYRRPGLTEWYRATALGVEQGFTVQQAPPGAGPLVVQLDLTTDLAGTPDADGRGLTFAAPAGQTLHYDHVRAWDANGAPLDAALRYAQAPGQVRLEVSDRGAAYPITIDPLIYREQKAIASGAAGDEFGTSVALSGDTALVGAVRDDVGAGYGQGSAYIFTRSGTTWSLQQQLTASDGAAGDLFGYSVALAGDTALVGAPYDHVGANFDQGSAYVFTRSGTTWTQQGEKLTALNGLAYDYFGASVALDGDTALVGVSWDDVTYSDQGSAYVFTRSGTTWTQQQQLTASDGAAYDYFGYSVALAGDTALVGAYRDEVGANVEQGSVYVFTRSGTTWAQQAHLTASDGAAHDRFGDAVALSGNTALVGAPHDDVAYSVQGSAYVFTRSGTTWAQQAHLTASDGAASDYFGSSVALDGNTALVGTIYDTVGANASQGSAYVFTRSGTTWTQQAHLTASDGAAGDWFSDSMALDGDTALVGAPFDDVGANADQGAAYIFTRSGTTWTQQGEKLIGSNGAAGDYFGWSAALAGDTALVGAYGTNSYQGAAYVFTRSGTTWSLQQQLTASDGVEYDNFGSAVALAGDTALVGAFYDDVGANTAQGSAYVFTRSGTTWTQQQKLTVSDGAKDDWFGHAVALVGDTALVGAPNHGVTYSDQGAAYVFTRSGTTWSLQQQLTGSDGAAGDNFGYAVALSGDTALVGAPFDDGGANADQGSATVFTRSGTTWTQQGEKLTASNGAAYDYFGSAVALVGDTALVGAPNDDVTYSDQGSATVFTRSGTTWTQQAYLTASDGAAEDYLGWSVALSGDTALVGAPNDDVGVNTDQGSATVFTRSGTTWTQKGKLTASGGAAEDYLGHSVVLTGDTALVGAPNDDVGANADQGSAHFYDLLLEIRYLPRVLKNAP